MIWALLLACDAELKCPSGFIEDPMRAKTILTLIEQPENIKICWGQIRLSVIDDKNRLLMDTGLVEKTAAARAAHLLHHAGKEIPPGPDCLNSWIEEEAKAMAIELNLLQKWGMETVQYSYAEVYFSAGKAQGVAALKTFIKENPDGARGMDALVNGYKNRCGETP